MSVLVHDPTPHARRERSIIAAAVAATLAIVLAPLAGAMLSTDGPVLLVEEEPLPEAAQRVLTEMPDAVRIGGMVVVPAATDPYVSWSGAVGADRIDGEAVSLGVRGIAEYGYLPSAASTPEWLTSLAPSDNVYSEVGPLSFACTRWPGASDCRGAVLAEKDGNLHVLRSGIGSPDSPQKVARVNGIGSGGRRDVWFGWLPRDAGSVWVTIVGHQGVKELPARTSDPGALAGESAWWVVSSDPVSAVSFRDADGEVLERITVEAG